MSNSKKLQTFIKSNYQRLFKENRFSEISCVFLENLFLHIYDGFEQHKVAEIKEEILEMKHTFPQGPDYFYISSEIRRKIENLPKIGKKIEFTIGSRSVTIFFVLPMEPVLSKDKQQTFFEACDDYTKKVYSWLYTAFVYGSNKCSRHLDIYLYFTNEEKVLPSEKYKDIIESFSKYREPPDISIGQSHSNSAFTFSCNRSSDSKENDIYIYRFEEWFKVLIHESFHAVKLDFSSILQTDINSKVLELYDVKSDPRFYETYTETWAELINIMFYVFMKLDKKKIGENLVKVNTNIERKVYVRGLIRKVEKVLELEQMFSMFQCAKILNHFGLTYRELVSMDIESSKKRSELYKEKTQVLSYYIMKSVFLWNVENFVEWCAIKNRGSIQFLSKRNVFDLIEWLKQLYREPTYMKTIESIEKGFEKKGVSPTIFTRTTLRMTLIET